MSRISRLVVNSYFSGQIATTLCAQVNKFENMQKYEYDIVNEASTPLAGYICCQLTGILLHFIISEDKKKE